MPSFLDTMAGDIYAGFRGKLRKGLIRRSVVDPAKGVDDRGDAVSPTSSDRKCEGFTEAYTDTFRVAAGIPVTDLKVCLFGASMQGLVPSKDDRVALSFGKATSWYQLRGPIRTDTALALYTCQAFPIPDPGDA